MFASRPCTSSDYLHDYQLDFYNWNKVFVRYCDGASFSGDAEYEDQVGLFSFCALV